MILVTEEVLRTTTTQRPSGSGGAVHRVWNLGAPSGGSGRKEEHRVYKEDRGPRVRAQRRVVDSPPALRVAVALRSRRAAAHFKALAAAALNRSNRANAAARVWAALLEPVGLPVV